MARVSAMVVGKPYRGHDVGESLDLPRRDARYLAALGRVEIVEEGAAPKYEDMTKAELQTEAENRGLDVKRGDGKDGDPLKDDYIAALQKSGA